ncbi:MAG: alpha/beta hydrolase [Christensenellales bacterium]|jgi:dipeptidyl aminopeptidase/acylaminoacyl peptidase
MGIAIIIAGIVTVYFIAVYFTAGYLMAVNIINPKKRSLTKALKYELVIKKIPESATMHPFIELYINNGRGQTLSARYFKSDSDKFVLLLHGLNSSSIGMLGYADLFIGRGYNVIVPNHIRSGISDGKWVTYGYYESRDALLWIDKIYSINPLATIGIMGESMGGSTALMTAANFDKAAFCIDYCGYSSMSSVIKDILRSRSKLLVAMLPAIRLFIKLLARFDINDVNPYKDAKNIKCPVLVLHSKADKLVKYYHSEVIINNLNNYRHICFENSGHGLSLSVYREEFTKAMYEFLNENY